MLDLGKAGAYISTLRKQKDMTQVELADMLNVSHQAVSKWERGESMPDIGMLPRLAEIFSKSIDDLLNGGEPSVSRTHGEGNVISQLVRQKPERVAEMINKGDVDLQAVVNIAPMLKPSMANEVVQRLDGIDIKHLFGLAPFLSSDTLNKLVDHVIDESLDGEHLLGIAPFLHRDKLDQLIDNIAKGELCEDLLMGIAPFVSREALGRLVGRAIDRDISAKTILVLAPFLGQENIQKLVKSISVEELNGDILAALTPFISRDALGEIVNRMIGNVGRQGKILTDSNEEG